METEGVKLKDYVAKNTEFWIWEHDTWYEVIYLGWESVVFMPKSPAPTSTIRYHFKQANGETNSSLFYKFSNVDWIIYN